MGRGLTVGRGNRRFSKTAFHNTRDGSFSVGAFCERPQANTMVAPTVEIGILSVGAGSTHKGTAYTCLPQRGKVPSNARRMRCSSKPHIKRKP